MAGQRSPGVAPPLIFPDPPPRYDVEDQKAVRRIIKDSLKPTIDFTTIVSTPQPIEAIASLPEISPFILTLLDDTAATESRLTLDVKEHQSSGIITTASIANLATENGVLPTPDTVCRLISIVADRACWVTLYTTAALRSSDTLRALPTRPTAGTGVLAEFVLESTLTFPYTVPCGPVPILANGDGTGGAGSANQVYYRIQNRSGSSHTVQVTFYFGAIP